MTKCLHLLLTCVEWVPLEMKISLVYWGVRCSVWFGFGHAEGGGRRAVRHARWRRGGGAGDGDAAASGARAGSSFGPRVPRREHAMCPISGAYTRSRDQSRAHDCASDVTTLCCYVLSVRSWTSANPFVPETLIVNSERSRGYRRFCVPVNVGCVKISGEWERRAVLRPRPVWPHYFRNTYAAIRSTAIERSKHYNNNI